jgi:hypothetical protein
MLFFKRIVEGFVLHARLTTVSKCLLDGVLRICLLVYVRGNFTATPPLILKVERCACDAGVLALM